MSDKAARGSKPLVRYRKMRDFAATPEPRGRHRRRKAAQPLHFYIQRHAARRLHYDFRLELDGVLRSWAVPKGPSLDPGERRLAVQTEDHPLEYGDFEGVIPEGQYGAGEVLLWDQGSWSTDAPDPAAALAGGKLKFRLEGEKLHGLWTLVRMHGRAAGKARAEKANWLLIKDRDEDGGKHAGKDEASVVAGVAISHPGRLIWAEEKLSKLDLARYCESVADWLLPQLADRPLALLRCPDGSATECFFQKHMAQERPVGVESFEWARSSARDQTYLYVRDLQGAIGLIQRGAVEFHTWGASLPRADRPDRITIDLDPAPDVPWLRVVEAARLTRALLQELGLESFLKTTGGKGLHLVVPLRRRHGWDEVKDFAHGVAAHLVRLAPDRFTANMAKSKRSGRIFIDYLRNGEGALAVAAYSPRARPGAPVSTPIAWDELTPGLRPADFNLKTIPRRLAGLKTDPWADYGKTQYSLTKRMREALGLAR